VSEYVTRFTQLSRYAPGNVDIDEKKQDWFLNGLNDGLAYALEARDFINFQDMVDKALVLENRRGIMERKRKIQRTRPQGSNVRIRVGSSSQGPNFRKRSADRTAQNASYGSRISNSPMADSTPQLPDFSLYTTTTTKKHECTEFWCCGTVLQLWSDSALC
jgi:hypothetical protein